MLNVIVQVMEEFHSTYGFILIKSVILVLEKFPFRASRNKKSKP